MARHVRGTWQTYVSKLLAPLEESISPMNKVNLLVTRRYFMSSLSVVGRVLA